jgi:hypothetical protein
LKPPVGIQPTTVVFQTTPYAVGIGGNKAKGERQNAPLRVPIGGLEKALFDLVVGRELG